MSANVTPPPPPGGQNPYGQQPPQQPSPYAASPYAGGAPGTPPAPGAPGGPAFNGAAYAPPAPIGAAPRGNVGGAVALGVLAMLAGAFAYAGIMRAMAKDDGHYTQISYIALAVGVLVGAVVGKVGGRHQAVPVIAAALSLLGVFLGQYMGFAMISSHWLSLEGIHISWFKLITDHGGDVWKVYKHEFDFVTFLFLVAAGAGGFALAKRAAN